MAPELLHALMRYKRWSDAELLQRALELSADFPELERGYVTALVRHFHTVDRIFQAHLRGVPHAFTSPNPAEPATLRELQSGVSEIDAWYIDYTRKLDADQLGQVLNVRFTDGQEQSLRRADILLHVCLHSAGHRAQVALLLQKCGVQPPPDRFPNYLRSAH